MNLNEFNEYPVNGLLDRLSKKITLFPSLKTSTLTFEIMIKANQQMTFSILYPLTYILQLSILQQARVRNDSRTLINNIFSNTISPNITSGNSHHLSQITSSISHSSKCFFQLPKLKM